MSAETTQGPGPGKTQTRFGDLSTSSPDVTHGLRSLFDIAFLTSSPFFCPTPLFPVSPSFVFSYYLQIVVSSGSTKLVSEKTSRPLFFALFIFSLISIVHNSRMITSL